MITRQEIIEHRLHYGNIASHVHTSWYPYVYRGLAHLPIYFISHRHIMRSVAKAIEILKKYKKSVLVVYDSPFYTNAVTSFCQKHNFHFIRGWIGGLLTNFSVFRKNIVRLEALQQRLGQVSTHMTKKECLIMQRYLYQKDIRISGLKKLLSIPQAILILEPHQSSALVKEASAVKSKTIAFCDMETNLKTVSHPILLNNKIYSSTIFLLNKLSQFLV